MTAAVAHARIVSDLENQLAELRAGLGVLRAVACDDTPQLDGVELTWLAHRLLDSCEVVEGHVDRLRDALCPPPSPSPAETMMEIVRACAGAQLAELRAGKAGA